MSSRSLPWGRLAAEFVVIIVGVLTALWVDELRQARADHSVELAYIEGLTTDLRADLAEIDSATVWSDRFEAAAGTANPSTAVLQSECGYTRRTAVRPLDSAPPGRYESSSQCSLSYFCRKFNNRRRRASADSSGIPLWAAFRSSSGLERGSARSRNRAPLARLARARTR